MSLWIFSPLGVQAQSTSLTEVKTREKTVVVEGGSEEIQATEGNGLRESSGLPGARTMIDLEPYANSGKTVADVLRQVAGVEVTQGGEPLSPARVRIRGSRPDQVLVIVDGVSLNNQTASPAQSRQLGGVGVDLASLPASRVASVEIVRGAAASQYGPNAAAGAIIVRTHPPLETRSLEASHTVGVGGFREDRAGWQEPIAGGAIGLDLSLARSDGEYVFYDPSGGVAKPEAERCAPRVGAEYRLRRCNDKSRGGLGLSWRQGDHQRAQVQYTVSRQEGLGGVLDPRPHGEAEQRRWVAGIEQRWPISNKTKVGLDLGVVREDGERDENTTTGADDRNEHTERRDHIESWVEKFYGQHRVRVGGRGEHLSLADRFFDQQREQWAGFGQWELFRALGGWEASWRMERISDVGTATTYRLGMTQHLGAFWGIKASHGTGFRPPTLYELHDPATVFGPSPANPDLVPEHSRTADAGLFIKLSDRFYGEVIGFHHFTTDQIVATADPVSPALFRFQNLERTRSEGVETSASGQLGPHVRLNATYQRTRAEVLADGNPAVSTGQTEGVKQVPGVAENLASAGVVWQANNTRGWRLAVDWRHVGRRYIDTANNHFLKPYQIWEATLGFPLWRDFTGRLTGRNLTNETYAEVENHPPPGRQLFLTVVWRWPGEKTEHKSQK